MSIKCNLSIPDVPGLEPQQLTVGRHFSFVCQSEASGEIPAGFDFSKLKLVTDENQKYEFVLIKVEGFSESNFSLDMVSYLTGELPTEQLNLTDGTQTLTASITKVKVDSVLPPPEKSAEGVQQPPEPFGFSATALRWPLSYTVFFVILFCAMTAFLVQQIMKRRRLSRLVSQLEDYNSALAPDSQFYKSIRLLEKQNYPISEIEKQFRLYAIRKYQVPLYGMSINEAMNYLKKRRPTLINERRELKNILLDLKKMSETPHPDESKKYLKKLYQFVDHSEQKIVESHEQRRGDER